MKRYMKNNKFDFFQSPHPRTKDFYNLIKDKDYIPSDSENNGLHFFHTPVRVTSFSPFSPNFQNDYCSSEMTANKKGYYDGLFLDNMENNESEEHYEQSIKQINEKLQYSEQLLINLTPSKNAIIDDQYLSTTVKKDNHLQSSPSQIKFYERGLKKLAFEAFSFVSHQKKTTYKQVAKKLINQINDQNQLEIQRKGQMNIKRRVYDALNVLIALGLLKRNGNKIIGKKLSNDYFSLEAEVQKQKLKKKQQNLLQELDHIKSQYSKKTQSINKKKKMVEQLRQKVNSLKLLTERNRNQIFNQSQFLHKSQNRISMPFICITLNQKQKNEQLMDIENENIKNMMIISQQYKQMLFCKYQSAGQISIIGDTDLCNNIPILQAQPACLSDGKNQRNKKIKHR